MSAGLRDFYHVTSLNMPCPNDFEESVTIEQVTNTADSAGGYSESWATRKAIFCKIEDTGGAESIIAGRLEHSETFNLTTHYDSAILKTDRVDMDGIKYKITRIQNIDRKNEYMIISIETGRT